MTENNKPEWFEIVESDGPVTPSKASKSLPLAAVIAAALVLGLGAFIAQPQEQSPANALENNSLQTAATSATPTKTQVAHVNKVDPSIGTNTASALQNPSIANLPTRSEDEGDEGDEGEND